MSQEDFIKALTHAVTLFTDSPEYFDANPQLRINPATFDVVIENGKDAYKDMAFADEAIEEAAAAQGDESESASDYQASRNPDFYAVKEYIVTDKEGKMKPDPVAIRKLAQTYF